MKIIVANECEKAAIEKLINALHDSCIEDIEDVFQETYEVDAKEISFYPAAFGDCRVEIDNNEHEVSIDTELIGTCSKCGCETYGTIDGEEPTLSDLFEATDPNNNWMCEACYYK